MPETAEQKQFKAASDAIENIKNNMFKNNHGKIDEKLLDKYNKIQKGYSNEVVPYNNKIINKYKRNEISHKELVNALNHGEFMAKRGKHHPELSLRKAVVPVTSGIGLLGGGKILYDNMMGNQAHSAE